ncbi:MULTISPECIES: helix-hairpin-helix domain-containing protein [Haloferax]|uniref:DUF4332 domain-containing protein n=2 Tax=Haloferax TaxID=2251 RepID=A0A6G1Z3X9_9EURY|nr:MULTISPECIES: helix-hairpin-helix domain-containing protein [Haloferax]KAB1188509.1 helix-hairpin-helix domain-containing protein [Haloferax sp. CBA1149]MRW81203.1 DUF4332 domain-containing protein [Haloferax marinisediminis]
MTGENDTGKRDDDAAEELPTDTEESSEAHPTNTDEAIEHLLKPHAESETDPVPVELQDLKFIGPATEDLLESSDIDVESIVDGEVCYRDLVQAGVNPGVAAKIRRWHSLAWSFNSGDDLDRRSSQVRGLGDDERAWVAASSGNWDADDEKESGDWTPTGTSDQSTTSSNESPTRDGDWTPSGSTSGGERQTQSGDWTPTGETGTAKEQPNQRGDWTPRGRSGTSADGSGDAVAAEAAWRERSKPTPLTTLEGVDEDDAELLAEAGVRSVRRLATSDPEHVADALQIDEATIREWKSQARDATK